MFYFIHTLLAILGVKYINNIYLLIFLLLLSHFILDIIPHWDSLWPGNFRETYNVKYSTPAIIMELADITLSLALMFFFYLKMKNPLIFLAVFVSLLPDLVRIGYFLGLKDNIIFKNYALWHVKIQTELPWLPGLVVQAIVTVIILLFLI